MHGYFCSIERVPAGADPGFPVGGAVEAPTRLGKAPKWPTSDKDAFRRKRLSKRKKWVWLWGEHRPQIRQRSG